MICLGALLFGGSLLVTTSCSTTAGPSPGLSVPRPSSTEKSPQTGPSPSPRATSTFAALSQEQSSLLEGARATLGDLYDDGYYSGGPPPEGRGACTDVVYRAYLSAGVNLQDSIEQDISSNPQGYPNLGDANINYRRAPNLIVWFERHTRTLPLDRDFQAGDIIFWSLRDDGVADHVGVVSDRPGYVIHNFPPRSREDGVLTKWRIAGHFRLSN